DGVESLVAVNTIRFAPGERCATAAQEAENVEPVLDCSDSPVVRLAPADRRGGVRGPFPPRAARQRGRWKRHQHISLILTQSNSNPPKETRPSRCLDEGETESRAQPLVGGQLVEILREPRFVDAIQGPNKPELPGPKLNGSTPSRADDAVD